MDDGDPARRPDVDFDRHMVIGVFVDEGEYREAPTLQKAVEARGELVFHVARTRRMFTMINPAVAVKVPRFDGTCRFVDESGAA